MFKIRAEDIQEKRPGIFDKVLRPSRFDRLLGIVDGLVILNVFGAFDVCHPGECFLFASETNMTVRLGELDPS